MNRDQDHKESLWRNMVTQLFLHEQIQTTDKKADFIIPRAERILATVKKYDAVRAIRYLKGIVQNETTARKILEVLKERYKDRSSGFVRKVTKGFRKGDAATVVVVQLT